MCSKDEQYQKYIKFENDSISFLKQNSYRVESYLTCTVSMLPPEFASLPKKMYFTPKTFSFKKCLSAVWVIDGHVNVMIV
jgi:hypothetical protein